MLYWSIVLLSSSVAGDYMNPIQGLFNKRFDNPIGGLYKRAGFVNPINQVYKRSDYAPFWLAKRSVKKTIALACRVPFY